jgi:hypothetical protein
VTYNGETKRFKITSDFKQLVNLTKNSFDQLPEPLKFFYMDEEQEVISVSCDQDLKELLNSDEFVIAKLFVAQSQLDAKASMIELAEESESDRIRKSFSDTQSEIPKSQQSMAFDKVSHADLAVSREPSFTEISSALRDGSQTQRSPESDIKMIETAASTHEAQSDVPVEKLVEEAPAEKLVAADAEDDDVEVTFEQIQ